MRKLRAVLRVVRGPFLLLPVGLVATGAAASAWEGGFSWGRTLLALGGLLALHASVNALNEASDYRRGIDLRTDATPFSGGSKTLPEGRLSEASARAVGYAGAAVGALVGVWFLLDVGWRLLPIVLAGAVFVLGYTDVLARTGVGELAAGLGLGGLPVVGAALVQDGGVGGAALAASVPATCMTFNLLLLNEFPDQEADEWGGRRNLVILLGRRGAACVYAAAALAVPAWLAAAAGAGWLPGWALLALVPSLLLTRPLAWALRRPDEAVPVPALGANVAWNLGTHALLTAGLALAAW